MKIVRKALDIVKNTTVIVQTGFIYCPV